MQPGHQEVEKVDLRRTRLRTFKREVWSRHVVVLELFLVFEI